MDITQKLKDRLAEHARLPMMPPGSENLARAALAELERQEAEIARLKQMTDRAPLPMLLLCPACGERHVDQGDFAVKPHHTHACQSCGMVWRPAIEPTVGVQFLPGFKDATP